MNIELFANVERYWTAVLFQKYYTLDLFTCLNDCCLKKQISKKQKGTIFIAHLYMI